MMYHKLKKWILTVVFLFLAAVTSAGISLSANDIKFPIMVALMSKNIFAGIMDNILLF